jgi:hypothetical protein
MFNGLFLPSKAISGSLEPIRKSLNVGGLWKFGLRGTAKLTDLAGLVGVSARGTRGTRWGWNRSRSWGRQVRGWHPAPKLIEENSVHSAILSTTDCRDRHIAFSNADATERAGRVQQRPDFYFGIQGRFRCDMVKSPLAEGVRGHSAEPEEIKFMYYNRKDNVRAVGMPSCPRHASECPSS